MPHLEVRAELISAQIHDADEGEGLPETPAEEGPGGTSTVEVREMEVQTGASLGYRLSAQRALGISPRVFTDVGAGADLGQEFEAGQVSDLPNAHDFIRDYGIWLKGRLVKSSEGQGSGHTSVP